MRRFISASLVVFATYLNGCTTVPDLSGLGAADDIGSSVTIGDVVEHVRCEIYVAALNNPYLQHALYLQNNNLSGDETYKDDKGNDIDYDYYVGVMLNLVVNDNGTLAPSFNFINPIGVVPKTNGTQNYTTALALQMGATRQRTYTETLIYDVNAMFSPDNSGAISHCGPTDPKTGKLALDPNTKKWVAENIPDVPIHVNGLNLVGDLGIENMAENAYESIPTQDQYSDNAMVLPTATTTSYWTPSGQTPLVLTKWHCQSLPPTNTCLQPPIFASTVQFTFSRSLGAGPNWSVTTFKGPTASGGGGGGSSGSGSGASGGSGGGGNTAGGSANGLLSAGRTDTHQLYIAFVPIEIPVPNAHYVLSIEGLKNETTVGRTTAQSKAQAVTQGVINSMILQNIPFGF
jgi:hypothetical protein